MMRGIGEVTEAAHLANSHRPPTATARAAPPREIRRGESRCRPSRSGPPVLARRLGPTPSTPTRLMALPPPRRARSKRCVAGQREPRRPALADDRARGVVAVATLGQAPADGQGGDSLPPPIHALGRPGETRPIRHVAEARADTAVGGGREQVRPARAMLRHPARCAPNPRHP